MKTVSAIPASRFDDARKVVIADIIGETKHVIAVDHFVYTNEFDETVAIYRILFDDNTYVMTSANGIVAPLVSYLATTPEEETYPFQITIVTRTSKKGRIYYTLA